uniref:HEAT repeat-containing protein 4-like n=1 Tax=Phallusia mammillata TaxID=59560 RepID=A0A6F9DEZ9_9ASCI|nr:HEAT repeat-containing protein 4-like [Phallusia mammillata]
MIKAVSHDFVFTKDVVKERCAHALPYDEEEIQTIYDCSDVIPPSVLSTTSGGRFDTRGYNRKIPGHIKKLRSPRAAEMRQKTTTVTERCGEMPPSKTLSVKSAERRKSQERPAVRQFFITEGGQSPRVVPMSAGDVPSSQRSQQKPGKWDEYVIGKLSKDTARWIVFDNIESGNQKERLNNLVRQKFGKVSNINLVREEAEDNNLEELEKKKEEERKKARQEKRERRRLEKELKLRSDQVLQQTVAQYYRLPRFLKQERNKVTCHTDEVNQSAQNLQVKHMEPPPPKKMEDFLNPAAGQFINATENAFEQQLYTNQAKPVFQQTLDKSRIIMDDFSEYQSNIQPVFPPSNQYWSQTDLKHKKKPSNRPGKITKGLQRWRGLPQPADFTSERGLNPPRSEFAKIEDLDLPQSANMLDNAPMIHIIEEWRSKWKLAGRWQEVTLADVIIDLENIHDHLRLGAVAACSMAALHRIPVADLTTLAVLPMLDPSAAPSGDSDQGHLPEVLKTKVRERLRDRNGRVRLAAAMCLYSLSECTDEVRQILEHNLENGVPTDRMACAQCLALNGSTDAKVIQLLIRMLLETDQNAQATALLAHVSQNTRLVHSLLAEQLNSCNWKDKVATCGVLSQLSGNINRDLVHKLSNLMWEDWNSEVRTAASRVLGHTGHGRDVHFDLREKLARGNERVRTDVLRKIAHLGIMTATLLPEFLKCFSAEYVSVRLETCRTAAKLQIADEKVVNELVRLTQFDPAWKIKAYAIKAIGHIQVWNEKIESVLVWALRFEDEAGVRLEACVSLRKLQCQSTEVVRVLQDRVLVEPDQAVKEEVKKALSACGMSGPEDNMEMIKQIKSEVRRLCKKSVVAAKVLMYENELDKFERKAQYIGELIDDVTSNDETDDDDVENEIADALRQSKTPDEQRKDSITRTPSITLTPCVERPVTTGTPRIETIAEEEVLLSAPPTGRSNNSISPDGGRT